MHVLVQGNIEAEEGMKRMEVGLMVAPLGADKQSEMEVIRERALSQRVTLSRTSRVSHSFTPALTSTNQPHVKHQSRTSRFKRTENKKEAQEEESEAC